MKKILGISLLSLVLLTACTKLDETIYSGITADNFYNNKQEVTAAVLRPYTHLGASMASWGGQRNYWRLNELTADQLALPQKGVNWYNGGEFIRLHYHTWTADEVSVQNPWDLLFRGVGYCNNILDEISALSPIKVGMTEAELDGCIAEVRVLRSFFLMKLMDLYGDVPIITKVGSPLNPSRANRKDVCDFIEKEVKESIAKLPVLSAANIGRMNKAGAFALLSELFLNSATWAGTPRWDDCIAAADSVISGNVGGQNGKAQLEDNLTKMFSTTNNTSNEVLFSIAYDFVSANYRFQWNNDMWHYNQKQLYTADQAGNNGVVVMPTAYDQFADNDLRKTTWMLIGPQFVQGTATAILGTQEYKGKPLVFVNNIRRNTENKTLSDMTQGEENSGARFAKYLPGKTTDANYWGNDEVIYRMAEVYFNKAEAIMRKGNSVATQPAVDLVNAVRKRAFSVADWNAAAYTTNTLTMDELLAERGREFIFEGKRRTDLVRFGKYTTGTWWDHQATPVTKNVFPIPTSQIAANSNITQNKDY
jgi:hypothetical protein